MSGSTYNGWVTPTRRRRSGDPTLDAAADATGAAAGTVFTDLSEVPPATPEEPAWMRDLPAETKDPAAPAAPPDPAARAAARVAREDQIVRALNPEQARAVTTTEGPLLILAGAGSGKTRVLAHRIAYLVSIKDVPPWRILAVTFTNRAAAELRERIISLVGEAGRDVVAGTFHSLAARVLRADGEAIGIGRRFVIYDTVDHGSLMKQILREEDMPLTGEFRPSIVLGAISRAKNEMLDPTFLSEHAANHRERTI
ncbi:MAG: ATP-dependent helicase UvrD/PcrA, partial [Chloroflexota bacterium]|nr:ATP-dependent helicase UvrD/PcrA [Chloroflexota bacterium]